METLGYRTSKKWHGRTVFGGMMVWEKKNCKSHTYDGNGTIGFDRHKII